MMAQPEKEAEEFVAKRKLAYQLTYQDEQPANVEVLQDLARFCRANETCVVPGDEHMTYVLEGRREVWLRIQQNLGLTTEQLLALYTGQALKRRRE